MSILMTGIGVTKRGFASILMLFLFYLSWYFTFSVYILRNFDGMFPESGTVIVALFNLVIVITLITSGFLIGRFNTRRIVLGSALATILASTFLIVVTDTFLKLSIVFASGVFYGVGHLAFLTFFWNLTRSEERGRVAGFAGLFVLPLAAIAGLAADASGPLGSLGLSIFFGVGTFAARFLIGNSQMESRITKEKSKLLPEKRTILLYLIPWILFALINQTLARNMAISMSNVVPSALFVSLTLLQVIASGFGAVIGGITADFFGRRLTIAFCLTLYGFALILGSFVQNYVALVFSYAMNGLNWGILWAMYTVVVWGDLADSGTVAKRYSLGLSIFYLASAVGIFLTPLLGQIDLFMSALLGCSLIFLSNAPLALAPELLSADFRDKVKLKSYVKAVKKIGKSQSQDQG